MMRRKLYIILAFGVLSAAGASYAADYVLYAPDTNKGGTVGEDGAWEITDECAASHTFLEQE